MTKERLLAPTETQEQTVRLAFDVSSYQDLEEEEIKRRLGQDLPAYAIEQGDLPDSEKTTSGVWLIQDDEVVHPELGPIINFVLRRNKLEEQEYEAFLKIRELILAAEPGDKICWFSPARGEYSESRVVLYHLKEKERVYYYEFTGRYDFEELSAKALSLRPYSPEEYSFPTAESLATTPILVRNASLEKTIEMVASSPHVWQDIVLGKVDARMKNLKEIACQVAEETVAEIKKKEDPIRLGAKIEEQVQARISWTINFVGGCGFSNGALLNLRGVESVGPFENHYSLNFNIRENKFELVNFEKKVFCRECPYCHYQIRQYISPGFECPSCHQVYTGKCS